jgi:hypothetical protein
MTHEGITGRDVNGRTTAERRITYRSMASESFQKGQ